MSKEERLVTVTICDKCGTVENYGMNCIVCGKDACYDCRKTEFITYDHSVYCSGSGDGYYCHECHEKQLEARDELLMAYRNIAALRRERQGFEADFRQRQEAAEKHLERLQEARK